jgi:type IV pilus assembly protein PilA
MVQMKKLNNKGFSLVELIIVIAIMAILVGVVGTQVIPYMENSRKAKDQQIISSWNTAAMSAYSNAAAKINSTASYTITLDLDAKTVTVEEDGDATTDGAKSIKHYFEELTEFTSFDKSKKMASKAGKAISKVVCTISADGSIVTKTDDSSVFDDIEN